MSSLPPDERTNGPDSQPDDQDRAVQAKDVVPEVAILQTVQSTQAQNTSRVLGNRQVQGSNQYKTAERPEPFSCNGALPIPLSLKHKAHYAEAMTIAAALTFDSGVLLCADTKHTYTGWVQFESTKIFTSEYADSRSVFVITGPVDWAVAAIQSSERALASLSSASQTLAEMQKTVERELRTLYQEHIYPHPDPKPDFTLLITLYSAVERRWQLFRTNETKLRALRGYDCHGTGAYLGHYLIRPRYLAARAKKLLDLDLVFTVAVEALREIKDYDEGCGKSSEVAVLHADGRVIGPERFQDTPEEWARVRTKLT